MQFKKKRIEQQKANYTSIYLQFSIQIKLFLDAEVVKINNLLIPIIFFFASLQRLSFVLDNYYFSKQEHHGFNNFINNLAIFSRPQKLFGQNFSAYSFLIPLLIILVNEILYGYLFSSFISTKRTKRISELLKSLKGIIQYFLVIFSYINSLQYELIFIPFLEMTTKSIFYYAQQQFNLAGLVFSVISLTLTIINHFVYLICIQQSLTIKIKNLNSLQQTINIFINPITDLLIILLNQFSTDQTLKFYLISCILLCRILMKFLSLFMKYPNIKRICLLNLAGASFKLATILTLLALELFQHKIEYRDFETCLIIITIPIIFMIFQMIFMNFHLKIIFNKHECTQPGMLLYKIASILDEFENIRNSFLHDNNKILQITYFKQVHMESCTTLNCICQKSHLSFEQVISLYLKNLVSNFIFSINKLKRDDEKYYYFLYYLSLVNYLGLSTRAFKQSNLIVGEDSDNYSSQSKAYEDKKSQRLPTSNSMDKQQSSSLQRSKIEMKQEEMIHIKIGSLNIVQKQRLNMIQEAIKNTMSNGLGNENINQIFSDNLAHAVRLFLVSEENNQELKNKIVKTVNRKKEFFLNLLSQNQGFKLFDQAKIMILKMNQLEDQLLKLYTQFPSRKMQALNTFYQSEVMNNYFQAFKLATVTSISDEKLFKMQSQTSFDIFSSKIDYLIVGFDDKSHKLNIRQSSNLIHEFFGVSQENYKMMKLLEYFLPSHFESTHSKIIQIFLQTGVSKFFRQINQNYCRWQYKFIKCVDLFFDINLQNLDDLTFVCFLQNKENQNAFIFSGSNGKVSNISKNLIQKLGYSSSFTILLHEQLIKIPIQKLFPKYFSSSELNQTRALSEQELGEQEIVADQSEYQILMQIPDLNYVEQFTKLQKKVSIDSDIPFINYSVDAVFHYRKLKQNSANYLIIEIREAKKQIQSFSTPQQTEIASRTPQTSQVNFNDLDAELELEEFQESLANIPKAIDFKQMREDQLEGYEYDQSETDVRFGGGMQIPQNWKNKSHSFFPNSSLMSPKDVAIKLIEIKSFDIKDLEEENVKKTPQLVQQYFSAVDQRDAYSQRQEGSSEKKESAKKKKNKLEQLQLEEIDKELQENIKMQMQLEEQEKNVIGIDDIGSQVSSVAAFKKSKYSKKYDLIQKLITTERFSNYFYLTRIFLTLFFALFMVFSITEILFSSNDLNRILQELDLLQLKSNILGPIDNYVVAQNAVINYAILNMIGLISKDTLYKKLDYSMNDITYNYENLKASFITQLSNTYLNPFFADKNFTVIMSEQTYVSNHSISAREALYLSLEAAYRFILVDYLNVFETDVTQGFFIYIFGNYETFSEQFSLVNQEMVEYSIERSVIIKQKWTYLMVPILVIGFFLLLIVIKLHGQYLNQYDQFIALFSQVEVVWIQRDIDRYKGITSLVLKDSDVLFQYQFDIELKERFLAAEEIRKEKISQNQKAYKQKQKNQITIVSQKSNRLPSLITYSVIFVICFSLCFISTSLAGNYFIKYPATTKYFNTLCEVSIASTGVFSARQLCYQINDKEKNPFFFLTNLQFFKDTFQEHIQTIDDFLNQMARFQTNDLITSDSFMRKIQSLLSSDVCEFLPSYKIQGAQIHCDALYGGVLRRGLTATLSTVRNALLNEYQQSNNFTIQGFTLNEELETGLISFDAIQNVKTQFQNELIKFTEDLIQQIQIINVCAFVLYILTVAFIFFAITQVFYQEFKIVLKFVLLMPQTSLFLDNQLDRSLKQLIVKNNLN